MTDTTFVAYSNATPIKADWLNDVNLTEYHLLGNAGTPPATVADILSNLGADAKYAALAGFSSSLGSNGWKKYPDASSPTGYFIEQWGTGISSASAGAPFSITFPIAFPNAALHFDAIVVISSPTTSSIWVDSSSSPLTTAVFRSNITSNGILYRVTGY
jgi:hypothetical protein